MMLILLGLPGSGKGTQSKLLANAFNLEHFSIGDMLRKSINEQDKLNVNSYVNSGNLVPDEIIIKLIEDKLNEVNVGCVLDGYPRNLNQAEALEKFNRIEKLKISAVILLDIEENLLLDRLTGRRISQTSGKEYHIKFNPPKVADICDFDGLKLIQRSDDMPDKVKHRLAVYRKETLPLIDYYQKRNLIYKIDAAKKLEVIQSDIVNLVKEKLSGKLNHDNK